MGLEDVTDQVKENYSQSSPSRGKSSSRPSKEDLEQENHKVIGSPPHQKVFSEDKWEDVKKVLRDEMGKNVNRVLNMPAEKRHELLHEAALYSDGDIEETEHQPEQRCPVCGKAAGDAAVEIGGVRIHVHHTAGQIESAIKEGKLTLD